MVFEYPYEIHLQQHGPTGYVDYQSYKPWLRDEFAFRCVYCLTRENWSHAGDGIFGADHILPKSINPEQECDYDNLLYVCNRCNTLKLDSLLPSPCQIPYGRHLKVAEDGLIEGITPDGERLIRRLRLNHPHLKSARLRWLAVYRIVMSKSDASEASVNERAINMREWLARLREWFGYPETMPDLSILRPPGGNNRPEGIAQSHYARRERGELPEIY